MLQYASDRTLPQTDAFGGKGVPDQDLRLHVNHSCDGIDKLKKRSDRDIYHLSDPSCVWTYNQARYYMSSMSRHQDASRIAEGPAAPSNSGECVVCTVIFLYITRVHHTYVCAEGHLTFTCAVKDYQLAMRQFTCRPCFACARRR